MSDPIDLSAERDKRTGPDAEHVRKDEFGRPLFRFLLSYEMDGEMWGGVDVWAYSMDDAQRRVDAMRASARLDGQAMRTSSAKSPPYNGATPRRPV
jgi:hypothetical protein